MPMAKNSSREDPASELSRYETLLDALAAAPAERPFVTMYQPDEEPSEETLTFGAFRARAEAYAALYAARGLVPGDTVVLIMPQGIPLMAAFAGAMWLGVVPTILAYPTFKIDP